MGWDDALVILILAVFLSAAGYIVITAYTGASLF